MSLEKIKGCLYGVLVGDALGATYEFRKSKTIKLPKLLNIVGGGPFNVEKGQITDDSELTLALMKSIIRKKKYDKEDVAKSYIRWFNSNPKDIGNTTRKAFERAKNYRDAKMNSKKKNKNSESNGFLMRISPLAILGLKISDAKLNKILSEEVSITHPKKICFYVSKLYVKLLIYMLKGGENMFEKSKEIIDLDNHENSEVLKKILESSCYTPYPEFGYIKIDGPTMGYCLISLKIAFFVLFNAKTFEDGMRTVISLGGDTDTNCAISGAFLGAKFGFKNIPKRWIKAIETAKYKRPEEFKFDKQIIASL